MRKKLIGVLLAGALPGFAVASPSSDQMQALQKQLDALQKEVRSLKHELNAQQGKAASAQAKAVAPAAAPAAAPVVDAGSPDYGTQPAKLTNDDVDAMKQQMANQQLKVDSLTEAANTGPIAGLSITGYIDPSYIYNHGQGTSSFLFANHENAYQYYNSTIGDLYLDIKKTFGVGPTAPSVEVSLMPNRGAGIFMMNEHGDSGFNILNTAFATVPLNSQWAMVAGLMPGLAGYEMQQSNLMLTLTHNMLFDFSDPGSSIGAGINYTSDQWAFKFLLANEQFRTAGAVTQTGVNALGDPITNSNKMPAFSARVDYLHGSALDVGGSFTIARQTLPSAFNPTTGTPSYGWGGAAPSAYGTFFFTEADATYTLADVQYNAELDYGQQQHGAFNGGQAQWYGFSLLAHRKFNAPLVGHMGVTARYDLLADTKNGGGGGGIGLNGNGMDPYNGFGIDADCLANSKAGGGYGFECKGAVRQDVALDLLFYPTQKIIVKVEYRHDWANNHVFLHSDGSYSKSNDLLGAQFIYSF
ncbi:hypothetical protein LMG28688_06550 [Paraburkholderia caffeinitolerans]|uniref:DUF3138 family protein n=1 Tax=Paraburkholderia caffeinitolerans TaxID=1723730 RepID=A0A6J5GY36_9BURK|nr:DUF3138 family protein [Paraburkholderia caffeinitolerans]CAB3807432.1 hypothetical protein LMG28688_06550 [Paraburkholderia caffeinitolerans]